MPKLSMTSATSAATHSVLPGYVETYEQDIGDWNVSIETQFADMDLAPLFKGAPDDMCQARHVGYVLAGRFTIRRADGVEEAFDAGEAFVIEPGHIPMMSDGCQYVAFTPLQEAREQAAVMIPNLRRWAQETGVELPSEMASS